TNFFYYMFTLKESKINFKKKEALISFLVGYVLRLTIPGGYGEVGKLVLIRGGIKNKLTGYMIKLIAEFLLLVFMLGFAIVILYPENKYLLLIYILPILFILFIPILRKIKYVDLLTIPNVKYQKFIIINSLFALVLYITFILQYQVILWESDIAFIKIVAICIVVLSAVGIPISVAGIGVRENVSLFFLAMYGISENIAISIPMIVFAFNGLIPAFIGALILLFGHNKNIFIKNRIINNIINYGK
ncbi:MAG: hypothetical protein PF551_00945, partial [Candidatus Marinimicrobia bacterium]|nr:hypothetical protein [Candidatus Neomarinimicrobiota bacterium]